jgi:glycosyltransferase involved in cell wall biosynthesis
MAVDLSSTLVVMPALNEEESIADVIREVFAVSRKLTILVVNDGSQDATAQVARSAGALVASLP